MKKMKTKNKCLVTSLAIIAMLMMSLGVKAQDVLIDPESGNVVSTVTNREETGFALGLGALWRHEQLALSLNATDRDNIEAGEIKTPSAVLGTREIEISGETAKRLTIIGGRRPSFLTVSLPKGYKITGYEIVLLNDITGDIVPSNINTQNWSQTERNKLNQFRHVNEGTDVSGTDVSRPVMRFYETTCWKHNETNSRDQQYWTTTNPNGDNMARYIKPGLNVNATDREIGSDIVYYEGKMQVARRTDNSDDIDINVPYNDNNGDLGKEFSLKRFNITNTNQLYFRLVKNYFFYGITIKSFKIYFSAEGDFEAPVAPTEANYARRVVTSGFDTNKTDIGELKLQSQNPNDPNAPKYFSYNYHNVQTLKAYNYIYQEDAVKDGEPFEVSTIDAHIHPVTVNGQNLYAFENDVYYAEPPVSVNTSSGLTAPIGFRIVGAKIEYLWGPDAGTNCYKTIPSGFYIVYNHITYGDNESQTVTPYYLNDQFHFTTNPFLWHMDEDGNITDNLNGSPMRYLACNGEDNVRTLQWSNSTDPQSLGKYNMHTEDDGNVYYYSDGLNYYNLEVVLDNNGVPTGDATVVKGGLENLAKSSYQPGGENVLVSSFVPGEYDLNIYNQETGETIDNTKSVHVTKDKATGPNNYVELNNLNNDAIKFEISGLKSIQDPNSDDPTKKVPTKALLKISLKLQALDPYISSMKVECKDLPEKLQLSQEFEASNFRVSGGSFIFYVPSEMDGQEMKISFSDLHSDYGDNTYWGETLSLTKSRYSFVTSDYFRPVSGSQKTQEELIALGMTATEAAKWPKNDGLYDTNYNPNAEFNATGASKVVTATAGNVRYKFNNAEDLSDNTQTGSAYLKEYPFSVDTYLSNYKDPDAKAGETPKTAKFEECHVIAGKGAQEAGKFFVFTADETRYNIAPTTDWQHRQYAFYRMDVKAIAEEYAPELVWTPVYDHALMATTDANGEEEKTDKPQFGLKLLTKEIIKNQTTGETTIGGFIKGYLTVKQINETITAAIAAGDDETVPKSRNQILYIDASDLLGVYNFTKEENNQVSVSTLQDLKDGLGANALIFLPNQTGTRLNNFVTLTDANTFLATNDIVLTDKQPFFTPYDLQIKTDNIAKYKRMISADINGQAELATLMLPFALTLGSGGVHENPDDTEQCSLEVYSMKSGQTMQIAGSGGDHGIAIFNKVSTEKTTADKPYMVKVASTSAGENDNYSFVVAEKGVKIIASPTKGSSLADKSVFGGTDAKPGIGKGWVHFGDKNVSASFGNYDYSFTNIASYSGAIFDRDYSEDVFYFAANKYLDLRRMSYYDENGDLNQWLYIYPFRGVYTYTRTQKPGTTGNAKPMHSFDISFDEMPIAGIATWLDEVEGTKPDLMIRSDKGKLTITANRSQDVVIRSVNGMVVKNTNVEAGNTTTVALPAGIYVVNNTKITVK